MRRFLTLVCLMSLAIPAGISISGCTRNPAGNYCNGLGYGQKITDVGTLHDGKQGFWLAFNNWGAYIYAANKSGTAKENSLYAQFRTSQTVKVTGTLRHFAEPPATKKEEQHPRSVQRPPEHFFFDAAEVEMSVDTQGH